MVQHRLRSEYTVETGLEPLAYEVIRWVIGDPVVLKDVYWGSNARLIEDDFGHPVVLIMTPWPEFRAIDIGQLAKILHGRVVIDPYGMLDRRAAIAAGIEYHRLGVS